MLCIGAGSSLAHSVLFGGLSFHTALWCPEHTCCGVWQVLKWLQGLRLSMQTGKNARREFSNGVLVAEVLSLYEPQVLSSNFCLPQYCVRTAAAAWCIVYGGRLRCACRAASALCGTGRCPHAGEARCSSSPTSSFCATLLSRELSLPRSPSCTTLEEECMLWSYFWLGGGGLRAPGTAASDRPARAECVRETRPGRHIYIAYALVSKLGKPCPPPHQRVLCGVSSSACVGVRCFALLPTAPFFLGFVAF